MKLTYEDIAKPGHPYKKSLTAQRAEKPFSTEDLEDSGWYIYSFLNADSAEICSVKSVHSEERRVKSSSLTPDISKKIPKLCQPVSQVQDVVLSP